MSSYPESMIRKHFQRLLIKFTTDTDDSGTFGQKLMYIWWGTEDDLYDFSYLGMVAEILDLPNLTKSVSQTPTDDSEAHELLQKLIADWLSLNISMPGRHAVVVTGCNLLERYQVSLDIFFEWASDTTIFIFVVPPWFIPSFIDPIADDIPGYVNYQPGRTLDYLKEFVGEEAVVEFFEQ